MNGKLYASLFLAALITTGCATTQDGVPGSATPTSAAAEALSGDQMRAAASGKTFEGRSSEGFLVRAYNAADGKKAAEASSAGKTYRSTGRWEIRGNTFCDTWDNPEWKGRCWTATQEGDSFVFKSSDGSNVTVRGKFLEGNPYNL